MLITRRKEIEDKNEQKERRTRTVFLEHFLHSYFLLLTFSFLILLSRSPLSRSSFIYSISSPLFPSCPLSVHFLPSCSCIFTLLSFLLTLLHLVLHSFISPSSRLCLFSSLSKKMLKKSFLGKTGQNLWSIFSHFFHFHSSFILILLSFSSIFIRFIA